MAQPCPISSDAWPSHLGEIRADGRAECANRLAYRRRPRHAVRELDLDQLWIDDLALDLVPLGNRHQARRVGLGVDQCPGRDRRLPSLARRQEYDGAVTQSV